MRVVAAGVTRMRIPERDISALVADAARVIVGFDAEPCANWASVSLLWPDR